MIYRDFQGLRLSLLGFGTMRLPTTAAGDVDTAETEALLDYAMTHGVNYYDTAWPYMQNQSETVVGRCLKKYPRESFYLATKFPGHMLTGDPDPAGIFEQQLEKCQVEYFDFYLLHNVYENDMDVYTDPKWGIIDYFLEQKRLGRIRHLGFSSHADIPCLTAFLERCGKDMEFCQLQLNYLDWSLQRGKEKYDLLAKYNIPVWVMEPVRGGKLAALDADSQQKLRAIRPGASAASFALRWLEGHGNIRMILSGMSTMEQVKDNIATFEKDDPVTPEEEAILLAAAEKMKNSVPCTACRYCCDGCPRGWIFPTCCTSTTSCAPAAAAPSRCSWTRCPRTSGPMPVWAAAPALPSVRRRSTFPTSWRPLPPSWTSCPHGWRYAASGRRPRRGREPPADAESNCT